MPQTNQPRNDCYRSCLRGSLRGLNYLLAIVGVLMTAYALFMWVQWEEARSPPASAPTSTLDFPHRSFGGTAASRFSSLNDLSDTLPTEDILEIPYKSLYDSNPPGTLKYPWFIYIFGGAGIFVFVTASVGIMSADCATCGITCFLGLYHALMVLMLLLQIALICAFFFDKSWKTDIPKDSTGEIKKLEDVIDHNIHACKVAGLSVLGLQLLALMVSCTLHYAEGRPRTDVRYVHADDPYTPSHASVPLR